MKNLTLNLLAALALTVTVASDKAAAQAPPMNMSWAFQSQMQNQIRGDMAARSAAQYYYNYMLRLRQMGYTGPSLPTGVTAESLQAANARLQQSYDAYNRSSALNSNRTLNAASATGAAITRGCQTWQDANGNRYQYCP